MSLVLSPHRWPSRSVDDHDGGGLRGRAGALVWDGGERVGEQVNKAQQADAGGERFSLNGLRRDSTASGEEPRIPHLCRLVLGPQRRHSRGYRSPHPRRYSRRRGPGGRPGSRRPVRRCTRETDRHRPRRHPRVAPEHRRPIHGRGRRSLGPRRPPRGRRCRWWCSPARRVGRRGGADDQRGAGARGGHRGHDPARHPRVPSVAANSASVPSVVLGVPSVVLLVSVSSCHSIPVSALHIYCSAG